MPPKIDIESIATPPDAISSCEQLASATERNAPIQLADAYPCLNQSKDNFEGNADQETSGFLRASNELFTLNAANFEGIDELAEEVRRLSSKTELYDVSFTSHTYRTLALYMALAKDDTTTNLASTLARSCALPDFDDRVRSLKSENAKQTSENFSSLNFWLSKAMEIVGFII
ncbi:MAG: hypothetical protein M1831_003763 [Alyxoria varia]|nr:MAG: hypothetical protein M1831_003763 [Alyxoria varia]